MDDVSTKAKLVDSAKADPRFTITLPRSEVDEALQAGADESELLLDVVRATNGHREQRRVAVAWITRISRNSLERQLESGSLLRSTPIRSSRRSTRMSRPTASARQRLRCRSSL